MHSSDGFLAKTFENSTFHLQKTGSGQFLVSTISILVVIQAIYKPLFLNSLYRAPLLRDPLQGRSVRF